MTARVVLLGPPGAGKGTQAILLAKRLGIPTISTGDIFRGAAASDSELGRKARSYMESGQLVPDELTNDLVRDRLAAPDTAGGFILDGYPRNLGQVEALEEILAGFGLALDAVLELTLDPNLAVARLLNRATIEGRADDTEPVIRERLRVYAEQTAPISAVYDSKGLLVRVDGNGEIDEVTKRINYALDAVIG